ncbi:MAG: hypothetical protein LBU64_11850 [Planctomycetota bacterium]|jgi:hypothetical protein|nr:hypothetical protein [Planctomycetota bacterium]
MAFVRDLDGRMFVRESFVSPENLSAGVWQDSPPALSGFDQCLARALMPWNQLETPDILGAFFASYAKSCLIDSIGDADHGRILASYAIALENRLGVTYTGLGEKLFRRYHFVAAALLDKAAAVLQERWKSPLETIVPEDVAYLHTKVRAVKHPMELDHIRLVADIALDYAHRAFGPDTEHDGIPVAEILWYYMLAVLFTPAYFQENADALRRDWPRIPFPFWKRPGKARQSGNSSLSFFMHQGRRIAELLAMRPLKPDEWPVLDTVAVLASDDGTPVHRGEWPLSPVWSVKSKINAVRPGKGETHSRTYTAKEEDELAATLRNYRIDWQSVREAFGSKTVDVVLCDGVCWKNIPEVVWEFEIGGYKVLRKWLSYRGANVFGQNFSMEDSVVFSDIARRLVILILIGLALDYA